MAAHRVQGIMRASTGRHSGFGGPRKVVPAMTKNQNSRAARKAIAKGAARAQRTRHIAAKNTVLKIAAHHGIKANTHHGPGGMKSEMARVSKGRPPKPNVHRLIKTPR